jgi:CRISPR-associated endonuclease/helicase Cas3
MYTLKARYKTGSDTEYQLLSSHLTEAAMFVELFSKKISLPKPALLTGLVHDLGKNCKTWAIYLEDSHKTGKKNHKEDHGTAGGQYLYETIKQNFGDSGELIAQLLAACVMYHHGSGLPDVIEPDGTSQLIKRLEKSRAETHTDEAIANLDTSIKQRLDAILADENFILETMGILRNLTKSDIKEARLFNLGLTARFLSSCLIDGDRRSSALFDKGILVKKEDAVAKADWKILRERLENYLAGLPSEGKLNEIRRTVSTRCAEFAEREDGIYTLSAATGAGKTLASLRYALAHAELTGKDHVFVIAPYTSILDQNADVIRGILDPDGENGDIVLEHHSNLEQGEKTDHFIDSSETWNVPIIITTMIQFLEVLFGYGTRKIRRMHQLSNSVIIFDEVQTLPIPCTYLFTWAIRYLCQSANVSILLCTATQPGFDRLEADYALPLSKENEIIPDVVKHLENLQRVELLDNTKADGWTLDEVAAFIEKSEENSILTVVNTKSQARKIHATLSKQHPNWHIVHLSANMCPAHRRKEISRLKEHLKNKTEKCVCISTRLIEAGVDIDFDGAIRFLAGFDSIIQTTGRCNRNGELKDHRGNPIKGKTWIINIVKDEEKINSLPDLVQGQKTMERILDEFHEKEEKFNHNLLHPELIARYFHYFYKQIPESLLKYKVHNRDETILDLLSENTQSVSEYKQTTTSKQDDTLKPLTQFCQSFETAWKEFEIIAQDTVGVIVPFGRGTEIIRELFSLPDIQRCIELLREAQQYSVNVYFNELDRMLDKQIIEKVPLKNDLVIYTVDEKHYDQNIGLTFEEGSMPFCNV